LGPNFDPPPLPKRSLKFPTGKCKKKKVLKYSGKKIWSGPLSFWAFARIKKEINKRPNMSDMFFCTKFYKLYANFTDDLKKG